MLHEITRLRQSNRQLQKRWFTDTEMDLFVWSRESVPVRFQLAYDKKNREHVISWDIYNGFRHYAVDTGEGLPDRYKKTPILIDVDAYQNMANIARNFLVACEDIEIGISDFIYARLIEYPGFRARHNAVHINQPAN